MIVHFNGSLVPPAGAHVSPFDRGFLFGDGVYEGLRATRGHVIAIDAHVERMRAGLDETRIRGFDPATLPELTRALLDANNIESAFVYWQVTRGAPRAGDPVRQRVPSPMAPTVFGFVAPLPPLDEVTSPTLRRATVRPDTRWERGWVKAISLLGGVLAAIEADEAGCDDAVLVRDGLVTEGVATNVFIATGGRIATPSLESAPMLAGVTRRVLLEADPSIAQRPITEAELRAADEIMLVGTTTTVSSVTHLDGRPVGAARPGAPGPASRRLLATLRSAVEAERLATGVH